MGTERVEPALSTSRTPIKGTRWWDREDYDQGDPYDSEYDRP